MLDYWKKVQVDFTGAQNTSEAGLLLLREISRETVIIGTGLLSG